MPSVFFVSDLHLGSRYAGADAGREAAFERWVRSLEGRASHLFLLGDVFEFWMEYRHFIPKHQFAVLAALHALRRSGVEVHLFTGNHDFNLGTFFRDTLGFEVHDGPEAFALQGRRVLLLHGDGMNPSDRAYRIVKRILRHPLSNWAWKKLHPDLGMRIALGVGKTSRESEAPEDHIAHDPVRLARYESTARALMREHGCDALVHGHIHVGFVKEVPEGTYVNTGEWLKRMEYVELKDGTFTPGAL